MVAIKRTLQEKTISKWPNIYSTVNTQQEMKKSGFCLLKGLSVLSTLTQLTALLNIDVQLMSFHFAR